MSKYDIVIVGSGLGGLECATMLSKEGYSVVVLEKNHQIGGNLQTFTRDKTIFDTGIHYIGGLDEGQNLNQYFKFLGIRDQLKLKKLDENGFDIVTFDDDENEYRYAQGFGRFIDTLAAQFPSERAGLVMYCDKIREVCANFPLYNLKSGSQDPGNFKYLDQSAREFINSCTSNPKLQNVLAGTNGLYVGEADKTPLYVHALVINTYIESAYRCIDGASQIARLLTKSIHAHGGKIMKNAEVVRFHFDGGKIRYAELKDGRMIEGDNFISNVHPALTFNMMEEGMVRKSYRKRIQSLDNSISVFILNLVLHKGTLPYFNHNYYHFKTEDVWNQVDYDLNKWPTSYALFSGVNSKNPGFSDGLIMLSYMKFDEVAKWSGSFNTMKYDSSRGEDYAAFKEEKAWLMMNELEKKIPNIRSLTKSYYTSTPLTLRDYIGTVGGSMYGYTKDYKNPILSFISTKTKIPNLYLTGQNLNLHGVLGVTIGSVITCSEFLGNKYLMDKIVKS
ncbi:MAG: NAD(P)/FAD-dependent oxidoreductase [Cyclobacteriaceae bacterium]|nr:NAD(P)/FAD-dependent oxidoreductase [Cyclobacteriaceae bacterium]